MNVTQPLLQFQNQLKMWHWMTKSFAQHSAFGDAYDAIGDKVDEFVEVYFGRFGREAVGGVTLSIKAQVEDKLIQSIISEFKMYLADMTKELASSSELLALRDDLLAECNHLLYRLSLS